MRWLHIKKYIKSKTDIITALCNFIKNQYVQYCYYRCIDYNVMTYKWQLFPKDSMAFMGSPIFNSCWKLNKLNIGYYM